VTVFGRIGEEFELSYFDVNRGTSADVVEFLPTLEEFESIAETVFGCGWSLSGQGTGDEEVLATLQTVDVWGVGIEVLARTGATAVLEDEARFDAHHRVGVVATHRIELAVASRQNQIVVIL